ncbi:MAG: hypothetical protein JWM54_1158 [Acidobacteriaceae bacterium]|nr:hypothetical protein [Acidobacteriaceae bacterium]
MNEQHSAGSTETDLCEDCDERPITALDARCDVCRENANERAYDRSMEEPTYRGGEYASAVAAEQAWIQRNLK